MAMRHDCKHFESRTYITGEVVRKCRLDLAPNAPFECPVDCPAFEKRTVDVGWDYGSLAKPIISQTKSIENVDSNSMAAVLDNAEDIVNAIAPELLEEFKALDEKPVKKKKKWRKKKK